MKISQLFEQNLEALSTKEIEARMLKVITPLKMVPSDKIEFEVRSPSPDHPAWEPGRIDLRWRRKRNFSEEEVLLKAAINSLLRANFPWLEVGQVTQNLSTYAVFYLRAVEEHRHALINRFKNGAFTKWAVNI